MKKYHIILLFTILTATTHSLDALAQDIPINPNIQGFYDYKIKLQRFKEKSNLVVYGKIKSITINNNTGILNMCQLKILFGTYPEGKECIIIKYRIGSGVNTPYLLKNQKYTVFLSTKFPNDSIVGRRFGVFTTIRNSKNEEKIMDPNMMPILSVQNGIIKIGDHESAYISTTDFHKEVSKIFEGID